MLSVDAVVFQGILTVNSIVFEGMLPLDVANLGVREASPLNRGSQVAGLGSGNSRSSQQGQATNSAECRAFSSWNSFVIRDFGSQESVGAVCLPVSASPFTRIYPGVIGILRRVCEKGETSLHRNSLVVPAHRGLRTRYDGSELVLRPRLESFSLDRELARRRHLDRLR